MVEHRIVAPACAGSSPVGPPRYEHVSQWLGGGLQLRSRWFESDRALQRGKVAPMVERGIEVPGGAGSSPAFTTIMPKDTQAGEENSLLNCQAGMTGAGVRASLLRPIW